MRPTPLIVSTKMNMPVPEPIDFAAPLGTRRLMVSDNPETLDEQSMPESRVTLWHDIVQRADFEPVMHRIFAWHLNRTGKTLTLGVTLENCSPLNRLFVTDLRRIVAFSAGDCLAAGRRLADRFMSGNWTFLPSFKTVEAGQRTCIDAWHVRHGELIGFLYEFTVWKHGLGDTRYVIRTVAAVDGAGELSRIAKPPLAPSGTHPRGSWPFADVLAQTRVYTTGETMSQSLSNGTSDRVFTASMSVDPVHALNNVGHFGARIRVCVPIYNDSGRNRSVRLILNPRGGVYAGTVSMNRISSANRIIRNTPVLRPQGVNAAVLGVWNVMPGLTPLCFDIMHAGASSLQLAVYVDTLA